MYSRPRRGSFRTRPRGAALLAALLWLATGLLACGPDAPQASAVRPNGAADAEWAWLQKTRQTLDQRRVRLAGSGAPADEAFRRETEALGREYYRRLVELINADPPVQGEPLSERQKAAIRLRSDEEILLAREFIERGGDYQRAIDIYREALAVDPGNPRLQEELARAQARRYMTQESFVQIQEGMDQDQVRRLIGQPNLHSVREWPDRGIVGWFYPKDANGAAAAVWFQREGDRYVVYLADFAALQPRTETQPPPPPPARPQAAPRSST